MTVKEKAKELVEKYHAIISMGRTIAPEFEGIFNYRGHAKQCALIAVDEILKVIMGKAAVCNSETCKYWQEVKEEINNL